MSDLATSLPRSRAAERMATVRAELNELSRELTARLAAASQHQDPRLTPQGLSEKRRELASAVRQEFAPKFAAKRRQAEDDLRLLRSAMDEDRPKVGTTADALMRSQMKWDQVRMRLEAGMPMSKIIETSDQETALAIREWAPAWLEARFYQARGSGIAADETSMPDTTALLNSIDDRLFETTPGQFRTSLTLGREAERQWAGIKPMLDHHEASAAGLWSNGLSAAIRANVATQVAGRKWVDPEPVEETEEVGA